MSTCLTCCVDVPSEYLARAKYGLEMLVYPYRCRLQWVEPENVESGGIYYGNHPERAPGADLRIGLVAETLRFFSGSEAIPVFDQTVQIGGRDVPVLFSSDGDSTIDVVAAVFFFLSGWQEHHTEARDEHGRFRSEDSIQARLDGFDVPYVDVYRTYMEHLLARAGIVLERKKWSDRDWAFCPTHDIDYVKKWRPGILFREIIQRGVGNQEKESARDRLWRLTRAATGLLSTGDPYERAMNRMRDIVVGRGGTSTFFFKTAARAPHDVGYSTQSSRIQQFFSQLRSSGCEIGLHPSYFAFEHPGYLQAERRRLTVNSGVRAASVRMHYLRYSGSTTARVISTEGFTLDSTVGFSDRIGFRSGTCFPYQLYDLIHDESLSTWEMPLMVMESALFNRMELSLEDAVAATSRLMKTCQEFGGLFIALWHNTLWDEVDCPGWGEHFERTVEAAIGDAAFTGSLRKSFEGWE